MTRELIASGSQTMVTVEDVSGDLALVASTPEEMKVAQSRLAEWFRAKIEIARRDYDEATDNLGIAAEAGWKLTSFQRQQRVTRKKLEFFEKCLAAVELGYAIVPNFPVDVFAVRTTRRKPRGGTADYDAQFPQQTNSPALGDGQYVSDLPKTRVSKRRVKDEESGKERTLVESWPTDFDDVEFPISLAKPIILNATQRALAERVFDDLGCLPERHGRGDPIIVGRIFRPTDSYRLSPLCFLVAWYVNTADL